MSKKEKLSFDLTTSPDLDSITIKLFSRSNVKLKLKIQQSMLAEKKKSKTKDKLFIRRKSSDIIKDLKTSLFFNMSKEENQILKSKIIQQKTVKRNLKKYMFNMINVG